MATSTLDRLSDLIRQDADLIVRQWTTEVMRVPSARDVDRPTLIDHMPDLVEEIWRGLRSHEQMAITNGNSNGASEAHGTLRFQTGFDLVEVVAEYNVLREVLLAFAEERGISLDGRPGRFVHRAIDHAIAFAVKAYAMEKTLEIQRRREEHFSFIVHDLKTPLAAIETSMLILDKYREPNAPATRFLNVVRRNAHRLHALISNLLHEQGNLQAQITNLEKRDFDVWPLVQELIHDFQPLADAANTDISNTIPEDLSVYADAHAVSRVFQNLLGNAITHTKKGRIIVSGQRTDRGVDLSVEDTGDGIAPDRIDKIFEKLESDSTKDGALGLGLAIVKEIVEAHNGTVSVESVIGRGSRFKFTLPLASNQPVDRPGA
jgi:two-component system phosphate regulon sensor histidine kinase PhoR